MSDRSSTATRPGRHGALCGTTGRYKLRLCRLLRDQPVLHARRRLFSGQPPVPSILDGYTLRLAARSWQAMYCPGLASCLAHPSLTCRC